MAELTVTDWEAIRDEAQAQILNALKSESYSSASGQRNTRNLAEIRATLKEAERNIARLTRGGIRITGGTPT